MTVRNAAAPAGVRVAPPTPLAAEMAAFDGLPARCRAALREAPFSMSAPYCAKVAREHGEAALLAEYQETGGDYRPVRLNAAGRRRASVRCRAVPPVPEVVR